MLVVEHAHNVGEIRNKTARIPMTVAIDMFHLSYVFFMLNLGVCQCTLPRLHYNGMIIDPYHVAFVQRSSGYYTVLNDMCTNRNSDVKAALKELKTLP